MNILLIYGHVSKDGYNGLALKEILTFLKNQKIDHSLIDLYEEKFDPILSKQELYTNKKPKIPQRIKTYQEMIDTSDILIFIYPVWWGSMPAIMKGFLDRVLTPGFAFKYIKNYPHGLLKDKKAFAFMTAGGNKLLYQLFMRGTFSQFTMTMRFCGIKPKVFLKGSCRELNEKEKSEMKDFIVHALKKIKIKK